MARSQHPPFNIAEDEYYNVPLKSGPDFLRGIPRFCNVPNPPPLPPEFTEYWKLRKALEAWLPHHTNAGAFWPHALSLGEPRWDRTLEIWIEDLEEFTLPWLHALQSFLQADWPLWRLVLETDRREDRVTVYPAALRIGDAPLNCDAARELGAVLQRCQAQRDAQPNHRAIQLKIVEPRFTDFLRDNRDADAIVVLAAFDVHPLSDEYAAIWICHPARDSIDVVTDDVGVWGLYALENGRLRESPILKNHMFFVRAIAVPPGMKTDLCLSEKVGRPCREWNLGSVAKMRKKYHVDVES
jgi:hypothetical protein